MCPGGGVAATADLGFWVVASSNSSQLRFVTCTPVFACLGNNQCSDGYVGPQVSIVHLGYQLSSLRC